SIRGKVLQKTIERSIEKIRTLVKIAEKTNCIDRILIQKIQLTNNNDDIQELKNIANESYITEFVHKKFIRFPNVSDYSEYGTLEKFETGKSVFLYHLLGVKTPFRCLKPWIKNELSMNSDGDFVPCCLTLNKSIDLHNVSHKSLKDVFESEEHNRFRKSIFWDLLEGNDTCLNCPINIPNLKIPLDIEESENFKKLKKMTISDWRMTY
ncbi:SPASM domain-containing protein, partial [Streptococcus dysgalactiae]|uniref:SPASM domain-containing protein n=1 Tax=Streptococcus dysgalactiae TaxID=1334 RepID=UPI0022B733B2